MVRRQPDTFESESSDSNSNRISKFSRSLHQACTQWKSFSFKWMKSQGLPIGASPLNRTSFPWVGHLELIPWCKYVLASGAAYNGRDVSPVSIQTKSLALRALRKRKPQETQVLALTSSQSWLPTQALAFLAVFVYATHATQTTQAIMFEWNRAVHWCVIGCVTTSHVNRVA